MTTPPDLVHPGLYGEGIPHELLAGLRRTTPVVWVDEPATSGFSGGPGFWAVLRHADVSHVSRHPEDFSSWRGTSFLRDPRPSDVAVLRRMMLNMDPPEHSSLRKIVNKAFTPQAIRRQLAVSIERHAREVVDAVCERGQIDFLAEVAAEMPLLVLADVLGAPSEDRQLLYSWTNRLVGFDDPEYGGDPKAFVSAFGEMFAYARAKTAEKRAAPGDDLWSVVVNAEVDGERLSEGDLDRFFQLLMIAGNDTTRNLIANALLTLSEHPDQFARLRADLSLVPSAIEEVLRFSPSVIQFRRTATRGLELGGQKISENDKVVISYASANRDEDVFDDPGRFDITREPNPHISFGDGTHFCLGANLARLQTRVLLTKLLTRLPAIEGVVAITTATYNGTPPDNAVEFARWLSEGSPDLTGVRYTVFGCGNQEWAATFQDFPRLVDTRLAELGAVRLYQRGEGDANDDFDGQLERWDTELWPTLGAALSVDVGGSGAAAPRFQVELLPGDRQSPGVASLGARPMRGVRARGLVTLDGQLQLDVAHALELELPGDLQYAAGDHLGVVPHNGSALVERVVRRFGLDPGVYIRISAADGAPSFLPLGERITVGRLLADYVELQGVAGRRDIATLLDHTEYPWTREALQALLEDRAYRDEVLAKRRSVLGLLEEHPTCKLPFAVFLQLLTPLSPRYYSISSSSRIDPRTCSITVGALAGPARSGRGDYRGVCSSYLFEQAENQVIYAFVRDTSSAFRLPDDPTRPVIMIAAGTGIAPFRGFLAERAALRAAGTELGPAVLVFGCRHPQTDMLYGDELPELAEAANAQLACAFSRVPGLPRIYVQDRIRQLANTVWPLLQDGAAIYVCGSTHMAAGVRATLAGLHAEQAGADAAASEAWLAELAADKRYLVDVWASS